MGASGLVTVLVAIGMSVWRSRQLKLVKTYGSARWADTSDIRKTGLIQPAGVFLGLHGGQYLQYEGPEHVLTFAPMCSGKDVGLVVPTLLSWLASVIIHDIKVENWRSRFSHWALLHKSTVGRTTPIPRLIYPMRTVCGMPSAVKRFRIAAQI